MSSEELKEIAGQWINAFNDHDLERLLSLYADTAHHYSPKLKVRRPETDGLIIGKQALRGWWSDSFQRLPTLAYELSQLTASDNRVFMEYLRKVNGEDDLRVGELLELEGHLIVFSRVYHG